MDSCVVGIDLGTTYFKVGLFDRHGRMLGLGRAPVPQETPSRERICELPISDFETTLRTAWWDACRAAAGDSRRIRPAGIAYASQANSFVLLDREHRPLTPLILWPDQRAADLLPAVAGYDQFPDRESATGIGLPLHPQFAINKIAWFQRCQASVWRTARYVMSISDYLVWRLTGRFAGDTGTAGLLGVVSLTAGTWWPEALKQLNLDVERLMPLSRPGTVAGMTDATAEAMGFPDGVPVVLGGLDHVMASFGAGVPARAPVSVSLGTVLACVATGDECEPRSGMCVGIGVSGFTRLTFCEDGGAGLEWYQRVHAPDKSMRDLDAAADAVASGCDGLSALPGAHGYPGLDGFVNASLRHTDGHYFRALMESSARSLRDLLVPLGNPARLVLTGGGARSATWRGILADVTGCRLLTTACPEPACRGAAMLAAVGAGWYATATDVQTHWTDV